MEMGANTVSPFRGDFWKPKRLWAHFNACNSRQTGIVNNICWPFWNLRFQNPRLNSLPRVTSLKFRISIRESESKRTLIDEVLLRVDVASYTAAINEWMN